MNKNNIKIDVNILEYIVECSDKYFNHKYFPDKAIDLIDEASSAIKLTGMHLPEKIKDLEMQIKDSTLAIEDAFKEGNITQAQELRKEQELLKKKLTKC